MFDKFIRLLERFFFKKLGSKYKIWALRRWGAKVGDNCFIACSSFGTEPYLIEIGNNVAIAHNSELITHDGGVWLFYNENPKLDIFGKIVIGDNTFIAAGVLILPNTRIGQNCLIGAGAVVRGNIPDNSVVIGNPGKVVMKTKAYKMLVNTHFFKLETRGLPAKQKKKIIMDFVNKK